MSAYGCTLTVNTGKIPSPQGDFVWIFTQQNFVDANNEGAINDSANSILNGGGNLRCYTDNTKTTQIPIEVVTFVTGISPQVQVWGLSPLLDTASTVYVEADILELTQPPVTDVYGRNAVWKDFEAVVHASEIVADGVFIDSTGNNHDTALTTGSSLATISTGHPFGGTWPDFTGLEVITLLNSYQTINNTPFTLSCLVNIDVLSNVDGLFGNRYSSGDIDWAQIQSNGRVFSRATGFAENRAEGVFSASTTGVVKLKQNASSLQSVFNSTVTAEDTTISGGESINNVNSANSFRVGGYFNNSESFRYNGRAAEFRIKREFDSAERDEAEENNILNSGSFWSTSAWEQQGGGGTEVADSSNNSESLSRSDAVILIGPVELLDSETSSSSESNTDLITFSSSVTINDSSNNTNSISNQDTVLLLGPVDVIDSASNSNSASNIDSITFSSVVTVNDQTDNSKSLSNVDSVSLIGHLNINDSIDNTESLSTNDSVLLFGHININDLENNSDSVSNTDSISFSSTIIVNDQTANSDTVSNADSVLLSGQFIIDDSANNSQSLSLNDSIKLFGEIVINDTNNNSQSLSNNDLVQIGEFEFNVKPQTNISGVYLSTNINGVYYSTNING